MKRQTIATITSVMLVLTGAVLGPGSLLSPREVKAQSVPSMSDYTASPVSVSGAAAPNVILVFDASGTVKTKAHAGSWDQALSYFGIFDSMKCYDYDASNTRFVDAVSTKATISAQCPSSRWDGNFLNWLTVLRFDTQKVAATGGNCVGGRNADGTCKPSGSPAKKTITIGGPSSGGGPILTGAGLNQLGGRVPSTLQAGATSLKFGGNTTGLPGGMDNYFCVDDDSTVQCADADVYAEKQFYIRLAVDYEPKGVIQDVADKARFGLMFFSSSGAGFTAVPVGSRQTRDFGGTAVETFDTNMSAMLDGMEEVIATGGTPFVETVYNVGRYYAQVLAPLPLDPLASQPFHPVAFSPAAALGATGQGSLGPGEIDVLTGTETCPAGYITGACGRDPNFYGSDHAPPWAVPSGVVDCCKNYVIFFSDGAGSGGGGSVPASIPLPLKDYGHATLHGGVPHDSSYMKEAGYAMDGIAYWMHTNDLRQGTIPVIAEAGHDLPGFQNVTVYTFFDEGVALGRNAMLRMAKDGGFVDKNGNNLPDLPAEYDSVNNYTGAAGADGLPDTFYESENAEDMKDKLTATFASILQRSSSGTSVSVLASSSTGEGALYQAYYYPSTVEGLNEIKWTGYTQGLFLDALGNIREDSNGDGKLVYQNDSIIKTRYDTLAGDVKVDRYVDANGDGQADSTTPAATVGLKEIKPIWEAGKRLALMASSARKILTWVDTNNNGLVESGEQIPFTTANSATLAPYLREGAAPFTAGNIINFIRGEQVSGLRDRQLTVDGALKVWKLGDPIHSTPTVVGPPKERFDVLYGDASYTTYFQQYRNRRQVAYVGANDGMLHAFNVGFYHRSDDPSTTTVVEHGWFTRTATDNSSGPLLGDELWGFIPYQLLPHLRWLADATYTHVYYVDLKPKVTDARIFTPDADHPNGWGTILIVGMRMGGSCKNCSASTGAPEMIVKITGKDYYFYSAYVVLDVTNPEVDPKILWAFSDQELGLTTSYPAVARVNPAADSKTSNTNAKWFLVVGSGPTGYAASSNQESAFFAVDLKTGPKDTSGNKLYTQVKTGDGTSFMGDLIALDANLDYRADVLYAGNVIATGGTPAWAGKLYRLTTGATLPFGGDSNPLNWGNSNKPTVLLADFPCTPKPCTGSAKVGPITAAPTVTADDSRNIWVFFGTGRYMHWSDKTLGETQYFIGVKDPVVTGGCTQTGVTNCIMNDLVNVSSATVCVVCTGVTTQVTAVTGVTSLEGTATTTLQGLVQSKDGWYTTLPAARERSVVSPTVFGGIVFFPTFTPTNDVCAGTGDGVLYALFYLTGSAYKESVVGTETAGSNTNVRRSISLGSSGLASQVAVHLGGQGSGDSGSASGSGCTGQVTGFTQSSTGTLNQLCAKTALSQWSRYISWINQRM